jgi:hypothetical protein
LFDKDTTATLSSEEIVEQSNRLIPPSSPQLHIEDMIHRLREVNDNHLELPIVQPTISAGPTINRMTIAEMTVRLTKANLSVRERSERVSLDLLGSADRWEPHRTDLVALHRPCHTRTPSYEEKNHSIESSIYGDRTKSSLVAGADHTSQVPFSELIDRLHRVNKEITTEPKLHGILQRKAKISISKSEDDLARMLHHVNCRCINAEGIAELDCDVLKPSPIATMSVDRQSHQSFIECLNSKNGSWIEEECGTATSADYIAFAGQGKHTPTFVDLRSRLADDDDDDSGCTLHASTLSCDSSVTWYEGDDIDEIPYDEDDVSASLEFGSVDENSFSS